MAKLKQRFRFETSAVQMNDGTYFQPLKESIFRWVEKQPEAYEGLGVRCRILYQLTSQRFVLVEYSCCEPLDVTIEGELRTILASDSMPTAKAVPALHALNFLLRNQFSIPEDLEHLLRQPTGASITERPQPRNPDHWKGKGYVDLIRVQCAHEVKVTEVVREIVDATISVVQTIREWKTSSLSRSHDFNLRRLSIRLFSYYEVDRSKWWGPKNEIPPKQVPLLQLRWPDGSEETQRLIRQLQEIFEAPLATFQAAMFSLGHPDRATMDEQDLAQTYLAEALPEIEELVAELREELDGLTSGETLEELRQKKGSSKPPPDHAFLAYRLKVWTGANQEQIAMSVTTLSGVTCSQGTVSRWIKRVEDWIAAGNVLPDVPTSKPLEVQSIDPRIIDMGANLEMRTPRQRRKGEGPADPSE